MFSPDPLERVGVALTTAAASAASSAARWARTSSAKVAAAVSTVVVDFAVSDEPKVDDLFVTVCASVAVVSDVVVVAVVLFDSDDVSVVVDTTVVAVLVLTFIVGMRAAAWVGRVVETRLDDVVVVGRATTFAAVAFDIVAKITTIAP